MLVAQYTATTASLIDIHRLPIAPYCPLLPLSVSCSCAVDSPNTRSSKLPPSLAVSRRFRTARNVYYKYTTRAHLFSEPPTTTHPTIPRVLGPTNGSATQGAGAGKEGATWPYRSRSSKPSFNPRPRRRPHARRLRPPTTRRRVAVRVMVVMVVAVAAGPVVAEAVLMLPPRRRTMVRPARCTRGCGKAGARSYASPCAT